MSLIFDGFPTVAEAGKFVGAVAEQHGLAGQVFTTVEEANSHDPFPFGLAVGPIVHIDRPYDAVNEADTESAVQGLVTEFGGQFAGT